MFHVVTSGQCWLEVKGSGPRGGDPHLTPGVDGSNGFLRRRRSLCGADVIDSLVYAVLACAVRTAIERAVGLDAVPDDPTPAVVADGRELLDRALEAVEDVPITGGNHLERQVIVVAAHLAFRHDRPPLCSSHPDGASQRAEHAQLQCSGRLRRTGGSNYSLQG